MNDLILSVTSYYVLNANSEIESVIITYKILARGAGRTSNCT